LKGKAYLSPYAFRLLLPTERSVGAKEKVGTVPWKLFLKLFSHMDLHGTKWENMVLHGIITQNSPSGQAERQISSFFLLSLWEIGVLKGLHALTFAKILKKTPPILAAFPWFSAHWTMFAC
jgi:hypothetical protein